MVRLKVDEGNIVKDTRENEQNQRGRESIDEGGVFPFIEKLSIERDWKQLDEDSEEAYQGF